MKRALLAFALLTASATLSFAAPPITMTWTVDGVRREALVYPPAPTFAAAKAPVIFAFHGHGGTMQRAAQGMRFQELVPLAVVVYMQGLPIPSPVDPQGLRAGWQRAPGQAGDRDLKFFDAVLATLYTKFSIDDRRIYAAGFSNGAVFSLLLWGERGKVLAAIGVCAGIFDPAVHLSVPRPVIHIAGTADMIAVYSRQLETMKKERQFNGCSATGQACGPGCTLYPSAKHAPVMTVIHPGGHVYPPWASARIAEFFEAHPMA
jgi:polyhydroxybutyrate depolymerase